MEWLADNWFWILIFIFFIWMHTSGHGMHGGHNHGKHEGGNGETDTQQPAHHSHSEDNQNKKSGDK